MGNRLTSIYTKTGDDGTTGLANGDRVDKNDIRIQVMGDIDELNSLCGVLIASGVQAEASACILNVQQRLFDIGGEIAVPGNATVGAEAVQGLEELIDVYNDELPALKEFILPGGSMTAAICHLSRSVCRRVERNMVGMRQAEYINPESLRYINRLSDFLFVLARSLNRAKGGKEVLWDSVRLKKSV